MKINERLRPEHLARRLDRFWTISREKIESIERTFDPAKGAPAFTVRGRYTSRGWTEWTEGFRFGSALLQFDASDDAACLDIGRRGTAARMAGHVTHAGVHDHGFTVVSTFGNLRRLMNE
jgi:unsaturated chondroitin disaccharide hydrolase